MLIGNATVKVFVGTAVSVMVIVRLVPSYTMCTWKMSPLCRLGMPTAKVVGLGHGAAVVQVPPPKLVAGTLGDLPPVYNPVELLPSPSLLKRSNFTATLLPSPAYPKPPPPAPIAVTPVSWWTKVNPSEFGVVN